MIVFVLQSITAYKHMSSRSVVFKFHRVEAIRKKCLKKAPECVWSRWSGTWERGGNAKKVQKH